MIGRVAGHWASRVGVLVLVVLGGQLVFTALDFDPRLRDWALMASASLVLLWLAFDVVGVGVASWDDHWRRTSDRMPPMTACTTGC